MARIKVLPVVGIFCALAVSQGAKGPSPSIELLIPLLLNTTVGNSGNNQSSTNSSISDRITASLTSVLRLPLPLWGTDSANSSQSSQFQLPHHHAVVAAVVEPLHEIRQEIRDNINLRQQNQQQPGSDGSQNVPPSSFLPDVAQHVQSTIAQLSILSHWPFPYETTFRNQSEASTTTTVKPPPPPKPTTTSPPPTTTTTTRRTTTTKATTQAPPTPAPTQSLPPPPPFPPFVLPSPITQTQVVTPRPPSPSLPNRIHNRITNRITSITGNIRLPTLSHLGVRPRPMLTEPPWVTELLGPTLEPPTTRAPTLGERVQTAVSNVVLFVPATLLNFWYENWGTQHVDRIISRIQISTPKPGTPGDPLFATVALNHPNNPFANFTAGNFSGGDLPTIAAFINSNGTLKPQIVHPVVNMTANTIEYQLRGENETTVLWTGSLSNDVFFGNKKRPVYETYIDMEDDEDEQSKGFAFNIINFE